MTMPGRVCVLGSLMMDLSVRAERRPQHGETLIGSRFDMFLGGKGFNQAVSAARCGAPTSMVGRVGFDDFGGQFLASLRTEGVDAEQVRVDQSEGTGIGMPLVEDSGENSIVVVPRANALITLADLTAARATIEQSAVLLLQLELPLEVSLAAARIAHDAGVRVVLNPAPASARLAAFEGLVDVLVPNEGEAQQLSGILHAPETAALALRSRWRTDVVITLGARGVLVTDSSRQSLVPGHCVDAVDTVGAGDVFCGALAARIAADDDLVSSAHFANAAAALAVTRHGAGPSIPTRAEALGLMHLVELNAEFDTDGSQMETA